MTTGATGETANKRKTDGERKARVGKLSGDMEFGQGNIGGWREGGTRAISGPWHIILIRDIA